MEKTALIMAGGRGERFWPESRMDKPKQFLSLTGDGRTRSDPTKPYGSGGLMAPRRVLVCSTWNAPREAFDAPANPVLCGLSLDTALAEITAPFRFCGFEVLPGFAFLDIFKNPKIKEDLEAYRAHLAAQFA